jgi:hypothetical protein
VKITAEEIIALQPCWSDDRIRTAIGRGKTPTQIAKAKDVSILDRRWVLTRLCARTADGRRALVLWAAGCAQDVRHVITDEDVRAAAYHTRVAASASYAAAYAAADAADAADAAYAAASASASASASAAAASSADAAYAAANAAAYAANATPHLAEQHLLDLAVTLENL